MSKLKYFDGSIWKVVNGQITGDTLPIGSQIPYGSTTPPTNWLVCDGSAVSRTKYAELFAVIGTSYGAGDGSTTFNLPDKRGRVPVGYDSTQSEFNAIGKKGGEKTHQLSVNELPSHDHEYKDRMMVWDTTGNDTNVVTDGTYDNTVIRFKSWGEKTKTTGSSQSHNNLQPYETDCWIIKVKQSSGVVANVANDYSTSQTDTYSCDYQNNTFALIPTILYAGSTTGNVTLSDSAANFSYLEIFYEGYTHNSTKVANPNGKAVLLTTAWFNSNDSRAGNIKLARVVISGTTIEKRECRVLNYGSNYANGGEENQISIYKVIGYK